MFHLYAHAQAHKREENRACHLKRRTTTIELIQSEITVLFRKSNDHVWRRKELAHTIKDSNMKRELNGIQHHLIRLNAKVLTSI